MYSAFTADSLSGAFEMVCYLFTMAAAVLSYLVTLR